MRSGRDRSRNLLRLKSASASVSSGWKSSLGTQSDKRVNSRSFGQDSSWISVEGESARGHR